MKTENTIARRQAEPENDDCSRDLGSPFEVEDRSGASLSLDDINERESGEDQDHLEEEGGAEDQGLVVDPYIKAEERQEFSDQESIPHDDGSDGAGSTIHVTPSLDHVGASEGPPSAQLTQPARYAQHLVPDIIEAPQEVQTLLNQYRDEHGRKAPPCGTSTHLKNLNHDAAGKATWLHVSGEVLEASLYRLSCIPTDDKSLNKRIVVVRGPTVGPFIVTYYCGGGGIKRCKGSGGRWIYISSITRLKRGHR